MSVRPELIPLLDYLARLTVEDLQQEAATQVEADRQVGAAEHGERKEQAVAPLREESPVIKR